MLYKMLNESPLPNEQQDAEAFDAVSPNSFGFDGELAIREQGFEEPSRPITLFEIGLEAWERHEWTVDR